MKPQLLLDIQTALDADPATLKLSTLTELVIALAADTSATVTEFQAFHKELAIKRGKVLHLMKKQIHKQSSIKETQSQLPKQETIPELTGSASTIQMEGTGVVSIGLKLGGSYFSVSPDFALQQMKSTNKPSNYSKPATSIRWLN